MFRRITGGALVALAALTLGGCATVPSRPLSPAESALRNQSSWFSNSNIVACLTGAALGGGICAALGGNAASCIASAVAGCGVTAGANQYMQYLRQNYATREQALGDVIGRIREDNQHAAELVATSQQVINEDLQKIAALEQAYAQRQLSMDSKQQELRSLDRHLKQLKDVSSGMDKKIAEYQKLSASGFPEVSPEIQQLIEYRNTLVESHQELLERRNVFAAG